MRISHKRRADSRSLILGALMCTMMLAAMDTTIVSTATPQIVDDGGAVGGRLEPAGRGDRCELIAPRRFPVLSHDT